MLKRFESTCDDILYQRYNRALLILDLRAHLDLLLSFMVVLFRQQFNENQIQMRVETEIFNRYIQSWNAYK